MIRSQLTYDMSDDEHCKPNPDANARMLKTETVVRLWGDQPEGDYSGAHYIQRLKID